MAKKKKKSVLDYDPLAWLNESEAPEDENKTEPNKLGVNEKSKLKAKKSASQAEEPAQDEEGFGFFAQENDHKGEEESEDDGFGFFTDVPEVENNSAPLDDNNFGFFAEDNDEVANTVNTETLDIKKEDAINLGSELTIKTVSVIKGQIEELMSRDEEIVLDAEHMIKIDTAGLQLLHSLKDTLGQTGHHIKWIGTSTVINDSAEIIGMPLLAPKSKDACYGFFEENIVSKDADDGSSGFF